MFFSVLLVEDDHQDADLGNEFLARLPEACGVSSDRLRLTRANTLAQASAEMKDRAWDLVLLDLSSPDSCGLETLSAVQGLSPAPVLVLTANDESGIAEEALAAGAQGCLVKRDFDGPRLREAMSKAISGGVVREDLDQRILQAQRLESLGVLTGGVAHDFKNMMTVVVGFAELIKEQEAPGSSRDYADRIQDVSQKASRLASQMLAYSRSDVRSLETLDLSRAAAGMKDLLVAAAGWRGAQVAFRLSEEPCLLRGDASQVEQVLLNLVTNASEACAEGSSPGEVRVTTDSVLLTQTSDYRTFSDAPLEPGSYARLSVADNGSGFDPLQLSRVFEPTYSSKDQGRGLGLAVVASILRRHGGGLRLTTSPRGAKFELVFPAVSESDFAAGSREDTLATWRGQGRVLHVEDEPMVQEPTRLLLELLGFEVTTVGTGAEALEALRAQPRGHFALVLLDLTMPGISGHRLVGAIEGVDHGSQLVLTSGHQVSAEQEATCAGYPFLPKPYMIKDLRELLSQLLDGPLTPST
jgi:signal transduction histidine kinase